MNIFKSIKYPAVFLMCIIMISANSCTNIFDQKDIVYVTIENKTDESIEVYGGLYVIIFPVPSTIILSGQTQIVPVEKGKQVYAKGRNTGKNYGSKVFNNNSTWYITG